MFRKKFLYVFVVFSMVFNLATVNFVNSAAPTLTSLTVNPVFDGSGDVVISTTVNDPDLSTIPVAGADASADITILDYTALSGKTILIDGVFLQKVLIGMLR